MQASGPSKKLRATRQSRQVDILDLLAQAEHTLEREPATGAQAAAGDRPGPVPQRMPVECRCQRMTIKQAAKWTKRKDAACVLCGVSFRSTAVIITARALLQTLGEQ